MTAALQLVVLTSVGLLGVCVVLTRDPVRLAVVNGFFGLLLVLFFVVMQAPDVAISELVISTVAYPLLLLAAGYRTRMGGRDPEPRRAGPAPPSSREPGR
jgi:uncharacterized MnhB-related membrane protein